MLVTIGTSGITPVLSPVAIDAVEAIAPASPSGPTAIFVSLGMPILTPISWEGDGVTLQTRKKATELITVHALVRS